MSAKPGTLCKLEKGKLLDTQKNFVDTFNWMVDFINNLKGDTTKGCAKVSVDKKQSDKPVITVAEIYYK